MSYLVSSKITDDTKKAIKKVVSFTDFEVEVDPTERFKITFLLKDKKIIIAGFTLVEQINCCGILVSTKTFVHHEYRGKGIAQEMQGLKEKLAKEYGYTLLLATVNISGNPVQVHILEKFGWKLKDQFVNKRTGNTVGIYTKDLTDAK